MKNKTYRFAVAAALLLAFCLVFAAPVGGATSMPDVVNGVITLTEDVILSDQYEIASGNTVTIDLAGHNITGGFAHNSETNHIYVLSNRGTLIITDSVGGGEIKSRGIYNYGHLTLNGGIINACDGNGGYAVNNEAGSTFIMNGGIITASVEDDYKNATKDDNDNTYYDATALDVPTGCTFKFSF